MENSSMRSWSTKRFVIEDNFTRVTSDGQPHGMLTIIAGVSGLLTAIIILAILASMVARKDNQKRNAKSTNGQKSSTSSFNSSNVSSKMSAKENATASINQPSFYRQRSSILSLLRRVSSIAEEDEIDARPRLISISCISSGNLEGNLNSAFVGSELSINESLKQDKQFDTSIIKPDDITIDMKKY